MFSTMMVIHLFLALIYIIFKLGRWCIFVCFFLTKRSFIICERIVYYITRRRHRGTVVAMMTTAICFVCIAAAIIYVSLLSSAISDRSSNTNDDNATVAKQPQYSAIPTTWNTLSSTVCDILLVVQSDRAYMSSLTSPPPSGPTNLYQVFDLSRGPPSTSAEVHSIVRRALELGWPENSRLSPGTQAALRMAAAILTNPEERAVHDAIMLGDVNHCEKQSI